MRNNVVQLSLFDTYTDVLETMEENKSELIELLEEYIDFEAIIPPRFQYAYYSRYSRKRTNSLESFIRALILKSLLGMKQNKQLLTLLTFSKELRDFCGFEKLPDESQITRFKQQFCDYIEMMFSSLVEMTEPICREIDEKKSQYLIYFSCQIGRIGLLSSVYTVPEFRRRGVAKRLVNAAIRFAKMAKCGVVQLTASNDGVKLYTALGFTHNGNFMQMKL